MNRRSLVRAAALAATAGLAIHQSKASHVPTAGHDAPMSRFLTVTATNGRHRSSSMAFNW